MKQDHPDAHVSTKINTFTFYKGGGGLGATGPRSQRIENKTKRRHVCLIALTFAMSHGIVYSTGWPVNVKA